MTKTEACQLLMYIALIVVGVSFQVHSTTLLGVALTIHCVVSHAR